MTRQKHKQQPVETKDNTNQSEREEGIYRIGSFFGMAIAAIGFWAVVMLGRERSARDIRHQKRRW